MVEIDRAAPEIPGIVQPQNVVFDLKIIVSKILNHQKPLQAFPGSQPVSFQETDIQTKLLADDYYVCEKTDGLRVLMFVIVNPVTQEQGVFLIDRENNYFLTNGFRFPLAKNMVKPELQTDKRYLLESLQNGTIIDGELVIQTNPQTKAKEMRYLMFDCLAVNGRSLAQSPTTSRLAHLGHDFFAPYRDVRMKYPKECINFPFKLSMKQMIFSYDIPKVVKMLPTLPHISDGLIFTPVNKPYVIGTKDSALLKWKPEDENTVDFKLILNIPRVIENSRNWYYNYDTKPMFELWVWKGGEDNTYKQRIEEPYGEKELRGLADTYSKFAELHIGDEEWEKLKNLNEPLNGRIVECSKDEATGKWKLLRFRDDKSNGNHVSVVQKVLESINSAVSIEDLEVVSPKIKDAWNSRHAKPKFVDDVEDDF
ncbi:Dcp1p-Dcp2p decapping enzyme complex alpha subunit [Hanseniaspora osmophila]